MLGLNYRTEEPSETEAGQGRVSRYAWGAVDYHDLIHKRLRRLVRFHRRLVPEASVRGVVDTAPLLEREFGQLAGLGWIGKNTLLLNKRLGSWFFLAALLTSEVLQYDEPAGAGHCGTCRACLDACPTGALVEPYQLDARRCISYLTIELRDFNSRDYRHGTGDWLFGCDVCQDVCPWNFRTPTTDEHAFRPHGGMDPVELAGLFALDDAGFRDRFRRTPLWRSKRSGILRNAALVLGHRPHKAALGALVCGLGESQSAIRGACAWALGRYHDPAAREALEKRLLVEGDPAVLGEIQQSLARLGGRAPS
jgi:epoxyqueuosine reductase